MKKLVLLVAVTFTVSASLLTIAGCSNPKINEFTVTPVHIGDGDTVHISYDVSGSARLTAVTTGGGREEITTYTLIVEAGGKSVHRSFDVVRWQSPFDTVLVFKTRALGADTVHTFDSLSSTFWGTRWSIGTIASASGRPIRLAHGGRTAVFDSIPSDAFRGVPIFGAWESWAPLVPPEVMRDPAHPGPRTLRFRVTLIASPQEQP